MRQLKKFSLAFLAVAFLTPAAMWAQDVSKEKDAKDKKEGEQIIITRKANKGEKIVVEVQGDKVLVNGKEVKEDSDGEISVRRHKIKDVWAFEGDDYAGNWNGNADHFRAFNMGENKAMLGVTTEQAEKGVEIQSVTKESAAEKAG